MKFESCEAWWEKSTSIIFSVCSRPSWMLRGILLSLDIGQLIFSLHDTWDHLSLVLWCSANAWHGGNLRNMLNQMPHKCSTLRQPSKFWSLCFPQVQVANVIMFLWPCHTQTLLRFLAQIKVIWFTLMARLAEKKWITDPKSEALLLEQI